MKNRVIRTISVFLVLTGIGSGAFAAVQIKEMNAGSHAKYLSVPAHFYATKAAPKKALVQGDLIGTLTIAALQATLPIYQGTDDNSLKKGVGHYLGSALPGLQDQVLYQNNVVLSGHRDSVFEHIGSLKLGQLLVMNTASGSFTYKIAKFRIVGANDLTVIVPTPTAVLTLTTCYPFIFFGNAPKRFIVSADLVSSVPTL
jgi:LPXTG-site transpeptidase (sortase) family protein